MSAEALPPLAAVPVDNELLASLYQSQSLDSRELAESWSAYLGYLIDRARVAVWKTLMKAIEAVVGTGAAATVLAYGIVGLAGLLVAVALVKWWRGRSRRVQPAASEAAAAKPETDLRGWDAAAWRAELAARLAAGELRPALEAAWWWLATSLVGERVDPSWTTRELVGMAGRRDLVSSIRPLDAMLYGQAPFASEALASWVDEMEPKLAP